MTITDDEYAFLPIDARSKEFLTIQFETEGVEIEAAVLDGAGVQYGRMDRNRQQPLRQQFLVLTPLSRNVSIAVHARAMNLSACYTIRVEESEPDAQRLLQFVTQTETPLAEATSTNRKDLDRAYRSLLRSRAIWGSTGQRTNYAIATRAIAEILYRQGNLREAVQELLQEAALWQTQEDHRALAYTNLRAGEVETELADKDAALALLGAALTYMKTARDARGQAMAHQDLGNLYFDVGIQQSALDEYNTALRLWQQIQDPLAEAQSVAAIASAYSEMGESELAIESYRKALPVLRAYGDSESTGTTLNNLALLLKDNGEIQQALNSEIEAIKVDGDSNPRTRGIRLNNMGLIYHDLGNLDKAIRYYQEALEIKRKVGDRNGIAATLNNLGKASVDRKQFPDALKYYDEALILIRQSGFRYGEARLLQNIGEVHLEMRRTKAISFFELSGKIWNELGSRSGLASVNYDTGMYLLQRNQTSDAIRKLQMALSLQRAIQDRLGESNTLFQLAKAYRLASNPTQAVTTIEAALAIDQDIRSDVMVPNLRATFAASRRAGEEFYIDLLFEMANKYPQMDYASRALFVSEKSRARAFLELLWRNGSEQENAQPELVQNERELLRRLDAKLRARVSLLSSGKDREGIAKIEAEINRMTTEYQQLQSQIARQNSSYSSLLNPPVLQASEIQQQLLTQDALLLEYFCGDEDAFLWAVTQDTLRMFKLSNPDNLRDASVKLYKAISGITPEQVAGPTQFTAQPNNPLFSAQAHSLSDLLLQPVAGELARKRRILIVPDGPLQYVPFAALSAPGSDDPMILEHEVSMLPSASTLALLRKQVEPQEVSTMSVAVFADPVYDSEDPRNAPRGHVQAATGSSAFSRLPFSRWEAESILSLVPESHRFGALGFDANRENLESTRMQHFRFVHFAAHGLIDSKNPELSALVLSQFRPDGSRENGFLTAQEILNLKLHAHLVVLSGCGTSLGPNVRGEGLLGLVRSFMYAGASRVISTLWQVEDAATAELMTRFYRILLNNQSVSASSALRQAQLEIRNKRRWSSPFYWAGFTIQGEYQ